MLYFDTWAKFATFEGRATRSEYWTFIILTPIRTFILALVSFKLGWTWTDIPKTEEYGTLSTIFGLLSIIPHISVSVRRLHDINLSGWWGWLFIPLGLPMLIVGLIGSKKEKNNNTQKKYLTKAVINHAKDIKCNIKPKVNEYIEKHSITKCNDSTQNITSTDSKISQDDSTIDNLSENEIYEKVMIEIENNEKVKSTWAKALAQSDGDMDKAKSLYIQMRVEEIKKRK